MFSLYITLRHVLILFQNTASGFPDLPDVQYFKYFYIHYNDTLKKSQKCVCGTSLF